MGGRPDVKSTVGQLADLVEDLKPRADWSEINKQVRDLEPGEFLTLTVPPGFTLPRFQAMILTTAKRQRKDQSWKLTTSRRRGKLREIVCFLVPTD